MLEDAQNHLTRKAKELDLGRATTLAAIQKILESLYPQKAQAKSLNDGVLKIITPSAAVASELRLNQVHLLKKINAEQPGQIERLFIRIGSM